MSYLTFSKKFSTISPAESIITKAQHISVRRIGESKSLSSPRTMPSRHLRTCIRPLSTEIQFRKSRFSLLIKRCLNIELSLRSIRHTWPDPISVCGRGRAFNVWSMSLTIWHVFKTFELLIMDSSHKLIASVTATTLTNTSINLEHSSNSVEFLCKVGES